MAVLPLYNMVLVPDTNLYLRTDTYVHAAGGTPVEDRKVTIVVPKADVPRTELRDDSFYPIGITGTVSEVNSDGYVVIHLQNRVNVDGVSILAGGQISLDVSRRNDIDDLDRVDAAKRLASIKDKLIRFSQGYQWGPMMRGFASRWTSIGDVAVAMAPWLMNTNDERYAILAQDSLAKRFDMMEELVIENIEITKIREQANSEQEEAQQKVYREHAIKHQMEYLQKQLDEMHPENVTDVRRLEMRLEESPMTEEARKEGQRVLARLKNDEHGGAEAGMLMDYLDLLVSLPWEKEPARPISIAEARRVLDEDHYGLDKVKKRVLQQIAVMNLRQSQAGSILLFVGAPGTGKTSVAAGIAKAMGREYVRVSLGGVRDEADIRGHRRTYIGSMPGRIIDGIRKCGTSNPVMVLDEVDKLSASYNGNPASALLEVLDPEQNSTFTDHYLNVAYDLSDVLFICTANSLEGIPTPLLDRMEVVQFASYTPLEKEQIAIRHLLPKAKEQVGMPADALELEDGVIERIVSEYTREAGVRGLKKRIDAVCRNAAVELVGMLDERAALAESTDTSEQVEQTEQAEKGEQIEPARDVVRITLDNLADYIDANPLHGKHVRESAQPGVVTGLAWTGVGGSILYIETLLTKGSGKVQVTGQLGDVMKESAQIAVSLVKSMFPEHAQLFEENDLHIHVPDGATPKDGPSAGITLTSALASLVSGVSVSPAIAMTGEVSLQGRVNPIGGLPEKLMAAQQAGVRTVYIPADNAEDLKDVASEVLEGLEVIPVEEVSEVLRALGIVKGDDERAA